MSIIQNAINSIQVGIEDYQINDERRSFSAVRNIAAGILLLYKEKLCLLSPDDNKELLIKQNIRPVLDDRGQIIFEGRGHKTVDVQSIKERFKSLGVVVDWGRLDEINRLRNELEHYYTSKSLDAVREIIAKSFLLIRDFLTEQLKLDPQETLGKETWSILLEVSDVYSAEEDACKKTIEAIDWKYLSVENSLKYLRCERCHSSLIQAPHQDDIYPGITLNCRSCNHTFCFEEVAEECIQDSLQNEEYMNSKDGGDAVYDHCHVCGQYTFIYEEGICILCENELDYTSCIICNEPLTTDDQDNDGKCGYCLYKWEKMMIE